MGKTFRNGFKQDTEYCHKDLPFQPLKFWSSDSDKGEYFRSRKDTPVSGKYPPAAWPTVHLLSFTPTQKALLFAKHRKTKVDAILDFSFGPDTTCVETCEEN